MRDPFDVDAFIREMDAEFEALFTFMTAEANENLAVKYADESITYKYLGEIDSPSEMRGIAPDEVVNQCKGKQNWFLDSKGNYFSCGDYEADYIFETGRCINW